MKKVFFFLAVAGMFAFTACNNAAEQPADTMPIEEPTAMVEEPVQEQVATDSANVEAAAQEAEQTAQQAQ